MQANPEVEMGGVETRKEFRKGRENGLSYVLNKGSRTHAPTQFCFPISLPPSLSYLFFVIVGPLYYASRAKSKEDKVDCNEFIETTQ